LAHADHQQISLTGWFVGKLCLGTNTVSAIIYGAAQDTKVWQKQWAPDDWKKWLREKENQEETRKLMVILQCGRPLGSDALLSKVEHALGRRLRPLPVGRPRKRRNK
jgi:hypothetical protein